MTKNQLDLMDENEILMIFHIINEIQPTKFPDIKYDMHSIKWIKHDILIKKIFDSFPHILRENHHIFSSILKKLGIQHEIRYEQPKVNTEISGSLPLSSSV